MFLEFAHYMRLMRDLIRARHDTGGDLSEEEESRHVSELDDAWNAMTVAEQEQAERDFGRKP